MIGEIGGSYEPVARPWIKENGNKKPVVGFNCWSDSSPRKKDGHAGCHHRVVQKILLRQKMESNARVRNPRSRISSFDRNTMLKAWENNS